jgi:putative transposase
MAAYLMESYTVSTTRACRVVSLPKSMFYYRTVKNDQPVIDKLNELVGMKVNHRAGQDKLYERIRSEGILWNYKRVRRVYLKMGLKHRARTRKRVPSRDKRPLEVPIGRNISWSMDFMHDTLRNKRRFRIFNVIDDYNRQALAIEADFSMPGDLVVRYLERVIHDQGKPQNIRVDNGPEFTGSTFVDWCASQEIAIQYIQPGKPMQNGYIERFNRTFRQDVLDAYLFEDLLEVRQITDEWMEDYNHHRPHESLRNLSPIKFCSA